MRLDRLRRLTPAEVRWRASGAARRGAERLSVGLRPPRWNRRHLSKALAGETLDGDVGAAIAGDHWQAAHDALAARLRSRASRFVLDPAAADVLRTHVLTQWPAAAADAVARADRILKGRYDVLGYQGLSFAGGRHDVDWHLDPVHHRRAPLGFWAGVRYLDPAVGDHKIIWEINRHQHWLQLGRALWLTRDERYARGIVDLLESWLAANPPLIGINWASMLEIGLRAISWTCALHFLLADHVPAGKSPGTPWLVDMLSALDRQLTHVEHNLSHYFSPNTHLTGEALALYVVGTALPEMKASGRWVRTGRRILLAEIDRQILADGGHVERSTHYQRYTLDFYLLALLTAQRVQDVEALPKLTDAVRRLADFTRVMADDSGRLPLIGDDDGGMLWPLAGRECNDVRDSLALAALVLERPDLAPWGPAEEAWWIAGRSVTAVAAVDARRLTRDPARADGSAPLTVDASSVERVEGRAFTDTGYVVARDGRGGHAVVDVGAHGYMNGGHAHADALAIVLSVANRPLLVDRGTATYTILPRVRDRMRRTLSHNTVTVDGQSQSIPSGPFHWRTRTDARLHAWRHNAAVDWVEAWHDGYAPVRHRRTMLRAGSGWLVADELLGEGRHSAAAHWHFDPGWMLTSEAPGRVRATHSEGDVAWLLHDADAMSLAHGDEESGLGWHAPTYGTLVPAWTARTVREGVGPLTLITWIAAARAATDVPLLHRINPTSEPGGRAIAAHVVEGHRTSVFMLRPDEPPARDTRGCDVRDYRTDARVLHYASAGDQFLEIDLIDATRAVALRDAWLSVTADQPIADVHIAIVDGAALDLVASTPPPRLRVEGAALTTLRSVRLNGREWPPALRSPGHPSFLIHGDEWSSGGPPASAAKYGASLA